MKYSVRKKDRKKFEKRADIYDCIYRLIDCPDLTEFMLVIRVRGLWRFLLCILEDLLNRQSFTLGKNHNNWKKTSDLESLRYLW